MILISKIKRWFKVWSNRRKFLRCHRLHGHEPFHMKDDGTWTCECGFFRETWFQYSATESAKNEVPHDR